jgi:hypothetical protein
MRGRAVLVLVLLGVVPLAACSDDDKDADTPSTTTSLETTSTTADAGSTTTTPRTTPSSTTPTTRAPSGNNSSVRLVGPAGPSSPVDCNAETTDVELRWTATGATKVELRIDDAPFASYGNGSKTELVPLECDGQPHEFEVTASAGGSRSSSSLTLRSA